MKCHILFSGKIRKNISLSSVELAKRVVKVKGFHTFQCFHVSVLQVVSYSVVEQENDAEFFSINFCQYF